MKRYLGFILFPLLVFAIGYFCFAFVEFSLNPGEWSKETRKILVFLWLTISPLVIIGWGILSESE